MKQIILSIALLFGCVFYVSAQKQSEVKFNETVHDFGVFTTENAVQKCTFTFTNVGNAPLIIHEVLPSCGCTVASFTKKPVKPNEKGEIHVTYNGKGTFPKAFQKSIRVNSNAQNSMVRLYIKGEMRE